MTSARVAGRDGDVLGAAQGVNLVGLTSAYDDGVLRFAPDLADDIAAATRTTWRSSTRPTPMSPATASTCPRSRGRGCSARRFAVDYSWLQVDAFDEIGRPRHRRGVSSEPGVYFLGLPWLSRRGSSFIWGVWHDAKHVAGHSPTQRSHLSYQSNGSRKGGPPSP